MAKRRVFLPNIHLMLISVFCLLVSSCSVAPPVIKIGLVGPFTGRHREIGYDVIYSARLAIREINESGGIGRYRVSLVALDDFGDSELARENALALSADPAVVAIVGHWLPDTTQAGNTIYDAARIPFVPTGDGPFGYQDPDLLPPSFARDYAEVTPFSEIAGPYAGSGYDALQFVLAAMRHAEEESGEITRKSVNVAIADIDRNGEMDLKDH